jgi:hypothetical protein
MVEVICFIGRKIIMAMTWKEAKESVLFKEADVVVVTDAEGQELDAVPMDKILDSTPVTTFRKVEEGLVEVVLGISRATVLKEAEEVETMKKVILNMWEKQKKQTGVEVFDYEEILMPNRVKATVGALKVLHIKKFTISSQQGSMPDLLAELDELGYGLVGLTKITNRLAATGDEYSPFCDKVKNAFLISAKK